MTDTFDLDAQFAEWESLVESGTFEEAYAALEASVQLLETGGLPLEALTRCYEAGIRLSQRCARLLREAELKITVLEEALAEEAADLAGNTSGGDALERMRLPFS